MADGIMYPLYDVGCNGSIEMEFNLPQTQWEVVTYMSKRLQPGSTSKKAINALFEDRSKDQGLWAAKINGSRMCGCNLIFDPENQATKSLRREQSSTHFADEIYWYFIKLPSLSRGSHLYVACWSICDGDIIFMLSNKTHLWSCVETSIASFFLATWSQSK